MLVVIVEPSAFQSWDCRLSEIITKFVMGASPWGWYNVKSHPALHKNKQDYVFEPGIVA